MGTQLYVEHGVGEQTTVCRRVEEIIPFISVLIRHAKRM
jgi:hypothetical protein